MSRRRNPPSGRTSPARPQFKAAIPELVCMMLKPDQTPCGERFSTVKGFKSHGRSRKKHYVPGSVPPQPQPPAQATTPPQQDHPDLYIDGPGCLSDYSIPQQLDTMPYVELLDLQVRVAETIRRLYCAAPDYAGGPLPERQTIHVSTPPQPTAAAAEKNEEEVDLLALDGELYLELLLKSSLPCDDRS